MLWDNIIIISKNKYERFWLIFQAIIFRSTFILSFKEYFFFYQLGITRCVSFSFVLKMLQVFLLIA